MRSPLPLAVLVASLSMVACTGDPEGDAIAIGDSFFDWNPGEDIPDVVGASLGLEVANQSVAGAVLTGEDDIRSQYVEGEWQFLLMDGGGNDLADECGCTACDDNLDAMISADGATGDIPDFVSSVADGGVPVFAFTYPQAPAGSEFEPCVPVLLELRERLLVAAEASDSLTVINGADVMTPSDDNLWDDDLVHPSEEGSRVLGEHSAGIIASTLGL